MPNAAISRGTEVSYWRPRNLLGLSGALDYMASHVFAPTFTPGMRMVFLNVNIYTSGLRAKRDIIFWMVRTYIWLALRTTGHLDAVIWYTMPSRSLPLPFTSCMRYETLRCTDSFCVCHMIYTRFCAFWFCLCSPKNIYTILFVVATHKITSYHNHLFLSSSYPHNIIEYLPSWVWSIPGINQSKDAI